MSSSAGKLTRSANQLTGAADWSGCPAPCHGYLSQRADDFIWFADELIWFADELICFEDEPIWFEDHLKLTAEPIR
ncbi:MAG TPA: hypothetical protein DE312_03795 [Gallionella sp.]|nr:MAG: hypothetical protein A2Z87_02890 [Gallionellales bacterium GWA2_54_124]OGS67597.1 MAG: hypothetical protein A2Z87_05450 [Gallionellales bacterium GWA2_54_124]OGT28383.1 MAG: hypothetical protein A3K00_10470 [Gallionellales bacterium RIFOXYD2_FULL_52_7]HCI51940.1 hypothetical protein [Gallionella sp.]HCI52439.1 hypothetical protein [Gallionella sp.]